MPIDPPWSETSIRIILKNAVDKMKLIRKSVKCCHYMLITFVLTSSCFVLLLWNIWYSFIFWCIYYWYYMPWIRSIQYWIISKIGISHCWIIFTMFIIIARVTTFMTCPILSLVYLQTSIPVPSIQTRFWKNLWRKICLLFFLEFLSVCVYLHQ